MGLVPSSNVVSAGIQELRRSGVVRMAAEPVTATAVVAAGDALLADLLPDGGFPVGFISELRGNASSGRLTLAVRVLLRALAAGERAAFVTSVGFFPGLAPWLASALDGALFCRVTRLEDGLAAVEVLATTGSVDLLVIDAVGLRASDTAVLPDSTMARIERAARSERVAIVALTDEVSARAVALGSRPAIRIELVAPDSFIPNGARQPTVSLVRSRFNRASSSGSAPKQSRPLGAR
jgi:RecA/RadA recombinase